MTDIVVQKYGGSSVADPDRLGIVADVVPGAHRLGSVSYEEMSALAHHGAKVLNAEAVAWAERAGIEIVARATRSAPLEKGGTCVQEAAGDPGPRAITGTRSLVILHGPRARDRRDRASRLAQRRTHHRALRT